VDPPDSLALVPSLAIAVLRTDIAEAKPHTAALDAKLDSVLARMAAAAAAPILTALLLPLPLPPPLLTRKPRLAATTRGQHRLAEMASVASGVELSRHARTVDSVIAARILVSAGLQLIIASPTAQRSTVCALLLLQALPLLRDLLQRMPSPHPHRLLMLLMQSKLPRLLLQMELKSVNPKQLAKVL
jgi:hypothetical protein